jgi:hypothetical protein
VNDIEGEKEFRGFGAKRIIRIFFRIDTRAIDGIGTVITGKI